ncbi:hypothetical protein CfE428DRAFT_4821 [Chthoniobacter flavus Ellin428]|uniref:Uncharacterized protein n=1 Tax=Chthoniobacter flavus Ellin428 TaxID=497964 RepID=B4D7D1_9BACT|nr:hypothetical protein CfE428DRAFT_4821 [Chthoniobacter flavus Ellin428]
MAKAAESESWTNRRGLWQWTGGVCVGGMSGSGNQISGETCDGE